MLRGLVLVTAMLLAGLGVAGANAASPGRNGRIAFEHLGQTVNRFQIITTSATGGHRQQLTTGLRYSSSRPSYSPNGKRIVFVRSRGQGDLWTMRSDGSHMRRLTWTKRVDESEPAWSPDGKEIVFSIELDSTAPSRQQGIWVVGADGRGRHRLTHGADENPSWSPDGSEIAFDRYDNPTQTFNIFVIPPGGGTPTDLSSGFHPGGLSDLQPDWSPDGSRILFSTDRPDTFRLDLWTMKPDGSDLRQVTNTQDLDESDAVWSPDGRWIAYTGEGKGGADSYQVYVSRADGSSRRIITHACGDCAIINDEPSWQPLPG